MLEIPILKDIREYETRQVGPFSTREAICLCIGGVFAYGTYYFQKIVLDMDAVNSSICMVAAFPALAFGWAKPYGMKLERFIKSAFISNFVSPRTRVYKTEVNFMKKEILSLYELENEPKKSNKKAKKIKKSKSIKLYK